MREIQCRLFGGRPGMFFPTSVHVCPPSRLTCRLPSSVPAHTTPGITGDSEIVMIVLYETTPSFLESCMRSPGTPISVTLLRSICFVRSGLATHVSPRLYDLNSRLPPSHTMLGLCGDNTTGVFQLNRSGSDDVIMLMTFGAPRP